MSWRAELLWFALAALVPAAVAVYAFSRPASRASRLYGWVLVGEVLWIGGHALEVSVNDLASKLWLDGFQALAMCLATAAVLAFAGEYSEARHPRWLLPLFTGFLCAGSLVLMTAPVHQAVRDDARIIPGDPFPVLEYRFGLLDYAVYVAAFTAVLYAVALLVRHAGQVHPAHAHSAVPVIIGIALPSLFSLIGIALDVRVLGQRDTTFLSFGVAAVFVAWGIAQRRLLVRLPVARDTLFERIPDAALVLDADGGIADMNQSAAQLFGKPSVADAIGLPLDSLKLGGRPFGELLGSARKAGNTVWRTPPLDNQKCYQLVRHAFEQRQVELLLVRDITDQMRSERVLAERSLRLQESIDQRTQQLHESELKFRAIFDQSFQFMGLLSPEGRVLETNQSALGMVEISAHEVVGRFFWDTPWWQHSDEQRDRLKDAIARARQGQFVRYQATHQDAKGRVRLVDFSLKPVCDAEGRVTLLIPEGRDVTDVAEAEQKLQQAQKMDALGRLAGGVAHDFNNLLTVISGNACLALEEQVDREAREMLTEIENASRTAAALTQQLLAFSRKSVVKPRELDVPESLERLVSMLRRVVPEDIRIETRVHPELWHACFDDAQLQQVLLNLAVNARDAMPDGGLLRFEATNASRAHPDEGGVVRDWIQIDVRDTGHGMTEEQTRRVFEPFYTTKESGKGTGLGLAMVYGALGQHGGFVSVESQPGAGTIFSVYLPRAHDELNVELPEPAHSLVKMVAAGRIYIVEDDPGVLAIMTRVLSGAGFQVGVFSVPEEIISAARTREPPDLLVADLVMPGISGYDIACQLSLTWPELRVLFISGYSEGDRLKLAFASGAPFLAKPFQPRALLDAVREALISGHSWSKGGASGAALVSRVSASTLGRDAGE